MSIKRKLIALGYKEININFENENQVRKVIAWLEEMVIKFYTNIEDQKALTNISTNMWPKFYEKYVNALQCPIDINKTEECLDWLLGYAIKIEYAKKKEVYNKYAVENLKTSNVPNVIADNPLDHLDFTSKEFREGINNLANILKIPPHPAHLITLEACSKVIQTRLHSKALANPNEYIVTGTPFPYKESNLGFDLNDDKLNEAAKVLRLLYIQDLRDLQTRVNECIVAVQSVTANPKTDTRLGKVGK